MKTFQLDLPFGEDRGPGVAELLALAREIEGRRMGLGLADLIDMHNARRMIRPKGTLTNAGFVKFLRKSEVA